MSGVCGVSCIVCGVSCGVCRVSYVVSFFVVLNWGYAIAVCRSLINWGYAIAVPLTHQLGLCYRCVPSMLTHRPRAHRREFLQVVD